MNSIERHSRRGVSHLLDEFVNPRKDYRPAFDDFLLKAYNFGLQIYKSIINAIV